MGIMWLFTQHGFYSVVQDKINARQVQVRARIKDDLQNLLRFAKSHNLAPNRKIIATPLADYGFRIILDKGVWFKLAVKLAVDVDYTNFKDTVHGDPDRDYSI